MTHPDLIRFLDAQDQIYDQVVEELAKGRKETHWMWFIFPHLAAIAEANDAILFLPTGNTAPQDLRPEWPADDTQALVNLATPRNDALLMPAESVRD